MSPPARPKPCPACGAAIDPAHRPFCSQGCRDRDLLRWLDEGYALPGRPLTEEAEGLDTNARPPL